MRAAVTVRWVGTLQLLTSLALRHRIASRVMLANTAQEAAHRVPAVATVRRVDTPQLLISLVLEQTTVSLAMRVDMVREEASTVLAVVTVQLADTLPQPTCLAPLRTIA